MTIPQGQRAWQDNPEPPDRDEPTLVDRLSDMRLNDMLMMVVELAEDDPEFRINLEDWLDEYERQQLVKIATP